MRSGGGCSRADFAAHWTRRHRGTGDRLRPGLCTQHAWDPERLDSGRRLRPGDRELQLLRNGRNAGARETAGPSKHRTSRRHLLAQEARSVRQRSPPDGDRAMPGVQVTLRGMDVPGLGRGQRRHRCHRHCMAAHASRRTSAAGRAGGGMSTLVPRRRRAGLSPARLGSCCQGLAWGKGTGAPETSRRRARCRTRE